MISNKMIVEGMKGALAHAFKAWLDENKDAVLEIVSSSITLKLDDEKTEKPAKTNPKMFFTPNELAERWSFHTVSVLRLLRLGTLPTVRVGRRVLVPVADVEEYEKNATVHRRR